MIYNTEQINKMISGEDDHVYWAINTNNATWALFRRDNIVFSINFTLEAVEIFHDNEYYLTKASYRILKQLLTDHFKYDFTEYKNI